MASVYSQNEEERIIRDVMDGCWNHEGIKVTKGNFLDVGAWHAKDKSNTRALFEAGWGGLLIEPSPLCMAGLIEEYGKEPRVQLLQVLIMPEPSVAVPLHVSRDAVSTTSEKSFRQWEPDAQYDGVVLVPAITPLELFARFGGQWEFWSIDTEGTSVDVFAAMLACGPRPRCICVEHDSRFVELSQHAERANYRQVHENAENRIYEWTGRRE